MKRIVNTLLFLLLSLSLFAQIEAQQSRPFYIQGIYDEVMRVKVEPISTQSTSFQSGMPFDIEGDLIQYNMMKDGRVIAQWSMISNEKFSLNIKPGLLKSVNTYKNEQGEDEYAELSYILSFEYKFGYFDGSGSNQTYEGRLKINNDPSVEEGSFYSPIEKKDITIKKGSDGFYSFSFDANNIASDSVIGSQNNYISFMFTEQSTRRIEQFPDYVPEGDYFAEVVIELRTVEQ